MKKRIRWSEFLVEKGIATVAFVSLLSIVLIFIFVFREAAPIFNQKTQTVHPNDAQKELGKDSIGASGSYGDEPASSEAGPSETYGDAPKAAGSSDSAAPSESYGDAPTTDSSTTKVAPLPAMAMASMTDSVNHRDTTKAAAPVMSINTPTPPPDASSTASPQASFIANLLSGTWQPVGDDPKFGIPPLIVGSLKVSLIAILIAAPIGILAALYTSTFASRWAKEIMKPVIEIMAGFPSVVIGFFALTILASLLQNIFGFEYRLNAFVGGVAMSLAVIPLIYTLSEDALAAIPKHFTEGSLALGAPLWETNIRVVLPAAIPGIFAAVLLGIGRAFGETMIVLMATGNAALLSFNAFEPVRTISASIGSEMAEVVFGEQHYVVLFFLGVILFVFSFALNAVAEIFIRQRLAAKFGGAS